jgi:hypothetical protein
LPPEGRAGFDSFFNLIKTRYPSLTIFRWRSRSAGNVRRFRVMLIEFYFTPELHRKDGRIIRDLEDAASFAREQEFARGSTSETKSCTR